MGLCVSTRVREPKDQIEQVEEDALHIIDGDNLDATVDGQPAHVRFKPTSSGRVLLGAGEAMSSLDLKEMHTILEDNPTAVGHLKDLEEVAKMGVSVKASRSPAFLGLLVIDVESVVAEFSNPYLQIACEDDKSTYVRHKVKGPKLSEVDRAESGLTEASGMSQAGKLDTKPSSKKLRTFSWMEMRFIFVAVYSHAQVEFKLRDGPKGLGRPTATAHLKVADFGQGDQMREVPLMLKSKEVGTVRMNISYKFLRGTHDVGHRWCTDRITVDPRKLKGLRQIVSHVSNVNHWMLSHDNVWTALPPDHPALKRQSRTGGLGLGSVTAAGPSPKSTLPTHEEEKMEPLDKINGTNNTPDDNPKPKRTVAARWQSTCQTVIAKNLCEDVAQSQNAQNQLFQASLVEAFALGNEDAPELRDLKVKVAAILSHVNDRMSALEDKVTSQRELIMELEYRLDNEAGSREELPYISGRFGYGLGRAASNRDVLLFCKRSQHGTEPEEWPIMYLGRHMTDSSGTLGPIEVERSIVTQPGHYNVVALLPQDNTFARGSLFVLRPGTKCVLFDLDGTITVGDQEVVAQFALNAFAATTEIGDRLLTRAYDQKARSHARTLVRLWAAKGYQPIYLSGRQGSFYNLTLQWLINHNFPPGPIHLTRTHLPTLPIYFSVGNFKVEYMEFLKKKGFELYAAYGNTGTDVRAYAAAGVPKERTYTIGQAAGAQGTVKIKNWTEHLSIVLDMPESDVPIEYVDLLWASLPSYHGSGKKKKRETRSCGSIYALDKQASGRDNLSPSMVHTDATGDDLAEQSDADTETFDMDTAGVEEEENDTDDGSSKA